MAAGAGALAGIAGTHLTTTVVGAGEAGATLTMATTATLITITATTMAGLM